MFAGAAVSLLLATGIGAPDSVKADPTALGPRLEVARIGVDVAPEDTVRPRRRAVRLSEAYHTRLRIHKLSSYAMLPMFAYEYAAGTQLMQKSAAAPAWARVGHRAVADGLLVLFTVNTYTGARNWWETRSQESGRTWRTAHSALMLLSDLGFSVAGQLSKPAETSIVTRRLHKQIAITSIGVATVSYAMMLKPFRRD
jgi:hypothetical protein